MNGEQQVWASLEPVTDPELDESVTELGFVKSVEVTQNKVNIQFHLPTYWCAANFAYMMASDMHKAVLGLSWVDQVEIELLDHMYADTINRGIKANQSFQDTFGDEASDEIDVVRATFRKKAFQQRQELLLRNLLTLNFTKHKLVNMHMSELQNLHTGDDQARRVLDRYLEIRHERGAQADAQSRAFVTVNGNKLSESRFDNYLQELRSTRINTQFNGELCRGLLRARYASKGANHSNSPQEVPVNFHTMADIQSTQ